MKRMGALRQCFCLIPSSCPTDKPLDSAVTRDRKADSMAGTEAKASKKKAEASADKTAASADAKADKAENKADKSK